MKHGDYSQHQPQFRESSFLKNRQSVHVYKRVGGEGIVKCPGVTHTRNTTAILLNMDSYSQNCLHKCKMGRGLFYSTLLLQIQSCCISMGQNTAHVLSTWIKLFTSLVQKHTAASVHWEISKKMALDKNVQLLVPHSFQG